MTTEYAEKRNFFRMNMDCNMEYTINGSGEHESGTVLTLSGDGISFTTKQAVSAGAIVNISITPENTVTPPLVVTVEVLRCEQGNSDQYEVAGNITAR
jgi:hypothetical protein